MKMMQIVRGILVFAGYFALMALGLRPTFAGILVLSFYVALMAWRIRRHPVSAATVAPAHYDWCPKCGRRLGDDEACCR